jgi:23S rRNA pseudouridine1911/1915/1917 synthase
MEFVAESSERLDRFLAQRLPEHSRTKLAKLIDAGEVTVDGQAQKPSFKLEPGMKVALSEPPETPAHDLTPAEIPLDIVYEDDVLLVVNKPRGLASHPAASLNEPSLVNALLARGTKLSEVGEAFRPGIVHRLDKETTGLMVVAKTDTAHVTLARQIEGKSAERRYVAVVGGNVERERFLIDMPIGRDPKNRIRMAVVPDGKFARTHVKRLARLDAGTLLACRLETGRTHQIRVHLAYHAMPVLGDAIYAPKALREGPMQLHAAYLAFDHPTDGRRLAFTAEPDEEFLGRGNYDAAALDPF